MVTKWYKDSDNPATSSFGFVWVCVTFHHYQRINPLMPGGNILLPPGIKGLRVNEVYS